jgi:hypothetical protein
MNKLIVGMINAFLMTFIGACIILLIIGAFA